MPTTLWVNSKHSRVFITGRVSAFTISLIPDVFADVVDAVMRDVLPNEHWETY